MFRFQIFTVAVTLISAWTSGPHAVIAQEDGWLAPVDIPVWTFRGVEPGITTGQQLLSDQNWGQPVDRQELPDGCESWKYQIGDRFDVLVVFQNNVVSVIDILFDTSPKVDEIIAAFGLTGRLPVGSLPPEAALSQRRDSNWRPIAFSCGRVVAFADASQDAVRLLRFYGPHVTDPDLVAVGYFAGLQRLQTGIDYFAGLGGALPVAEFIHQMVAEPFWGEVPKALDVQRPWILTSRVADDRRSLSLSLYVPVTELNSLLAQVELPFGEAMSTGGGTWYLPGCSMPYVRGLENGWAVFSTSPQRRDTAVPQPESLAELFPNNCSAGLRVNVANIPLQVRRLALQEVKQFLEIGLSSAAANAAASPSIADAMAMNQTLANMQLSMFEDLASGTESVKVTWGVSPRQRHGELRFRLTAVPETRLARQMMAAQAINRFGGFRNPQALFSASMARRTTAEEQTATGQTMDNYEQLLLQEYDVFCALQGVVGAEYEAGYGLFRCVLEVFREALTAPEFSLGMTTVHQPQASVLAIGFAGVDATSQQKTLQSAVEQLMDAYQAPVTREPTIRRGGFNFISMTVPTQQISPPLWPLIGDRLQIVTAAKDELLLVGIGTEPETLLSEIAGRLESSEVAASSQVEVKLQVRQLGTMLMSLDPVQAGPMLQRAVSLTTVFEQAQEVSYSMTSTGRSTEAVVRIDEGAMAFLSAMIASQTFR
jgi:hypothetical protein